MNLAAFQSATKQKLNFQFQDIVDRNKQPQNWVEMLYRPQHLLGNYNVELFFKSLSTQQKVDLDIQIFDHLPNILHDIKPSRLSVNLMPISLLSAEVRTHFVHLLNDPSFQANQVCIEIIETQSMPPLCSRALDLLESFRAMGGWVALDDFGSGFAHWELLQAGLVDTIKVANQNLKNKDQSHIFVNGLSKFAESMQINTVLEGVETKEDFELGISQGFKNFQGWYFK